jgi:hypothetical protein
MSVGEGAVVELNFEANACSKSVRDGAIFHLARMPKRLSLLLLYRNSEACHPRTRDKRIATFCLDEQTCQFAFAKVIEILYLNCITDLPIYYLYLY